MNHRKAINTDLQKIKDLLNSSKLPSDDCEEQIENFIVIEENNKLIGIGGLEIYDTVGLIRSIVVESKYRGSGIGKKIYRLIEAKAYTSGIKSLYLLTETATEYFENLGFKIKDRSEVPRSIMETKQFKEICPSSAMVMYREISN